MSAWWQKWTTRFDALTLRERAMIGLAVVAVIVVLWQTLLLSPLDAHSQRIADDLQVQQKRLNALDTQIQALLARQGHDPNKVLREKQTRLEAQIAVVDRALSEKMQGLIAPTQMAHVLEQVLTRDTDLTLVRVRSLPARPLILKGEARSAGNAPAANTTDAQPGARRTAGLDQHAQDASAVGVYQHGLVIEFRGSYMSTLAYLRALQALPWAFYWDSVKLDVTHYPQARVVITVHTISLDKGWIGV